MRKMLLLMALAGLVCVSGCTTNNYYGGVRKSQNNGAVNACCRQDRIKPVESYSKSRYIVSREIIP